MHLTSRKKHGTPDDWTSTRVKSLQDTLKKVRPICASVGITRVSDITLMDRLYIPNYSAVLPGTEDSFWVYSGKGATKSHAKASALMEAIERYSSFPSTYPRRYIRGSYLELSNSYKKVLHPDEVVEPVRQEFSEENSIMDFIPGFDLLNNEEVLVPVEIALYRYSSTPPAVCAFSVPHTNGLASGNVLEEAICHALCEVIERDAVSIGDLCSSSIPYHILLKIIESLKTGEIGQTFNDDLPLGNSFVDDPGIFPDIRVSENIDGAKPIKQLIKQFDNAGIPLLLKDITQKDIGIPTILASCVEWITHDYGYFAKGFAAHPDVRIALMRALTEVSQTRAVNIHGARDDLKRMQYRQDDEIYRRKWQFMPAASISPRTNDNHGYTVNICEIKTHVNQDILDDIRLILSRLKRARLKRAIIVDLTNPNIGVPVVRVIVPGLETFEVTGSVMGKRAKKFFQNLYRA